MGSIDLETLPGIDWNKPDETTEGGKKIFSVRCRFPFSGLCPQIAKRATSVSKSRNAVDLSDIETELGYNMQERVFEDDGDGIVLPDNATGDTGSDDEVNWGEMPLMSGVASSTSVDFYGTEMSLRALKIMAVQMMSQGGVPYLPRHNNGSMGAVEWDEVIGRTIHAEVVPVEEVRKSYNPAESQFLLRVTTQLYDNEEMSEKLMRRIGRGESIGQSIGGWFTQLQVVQNDEGDVERVIVQGVELDHLAITRSPANPDSVGIVNLRDKFQTQASDFVARSIATETPTETEAHTVKNAIADSIISGMNERHILSVTENDDGTKTIVFACIHDEEYEEEMDEERYGKKKKKYSKTAELASDFADLPMAPIETEWSFSAEDADEVLYYNRMTNDPDWDRYKKAHAWYDENRSDAKSGYKLPIAKMIDNELHVVWRGVAAAMSALNGARGGIDVTESDRRDIYEVLVMYYNKFEKEAPELAELSTLDKTQDTNQHSTSGDAGTSASQDLLSTNAGLTSEESEEPVMNEQTLEALRTLLTENLQPLVERVQALENVEQNEEEEAEVETDRLEAVERKIEELASAPVRRGIAHVETDKAEASENKYDVNGENPNISEVAERAFDALNKASYENVSRRQLEAGLRDMLSAAEKDGIIVNPHTANWK